jgi:HSP20 family protein
MKVAEMEMYKWDPWWENDWPVSGGQKINNVGEVFLRVDVSESDSEIVIKAGIPNIIKEYIKVTVNESVLNIHGEREENGGNNGGKHWHVEPTRSTFNRSFALPEDVDISHITAGIKDGVLSLKISKSYNERLKTVEIDIQ